jgi:hypothetical protein
MAIINRREIPIAIGVAACTLVVASYFTTDAALNSASDSLQLWGIIIAGFAALLGLASYVAYNGKQIVEKRSWYSGVAVASALGTIILGLALSPSSTQYGWLSSNILTPLSMSVGSFIGFFIVSAAFRTFRARSLEAGIVLASAVIIMLKNTPVGEYLFPGVLGLGNWLNDVASLGGNRGFTIAFAVGAIIAGIRQVLGYERGRVTK